MSEALTVDELTLEVRRSARRRHLELVIDRGGELVLASPESLDTQTMAAFVREKKLWLYTKLAEKASRLQPPQGKQFVSGEGFPYLGRSYRLQLVKGSDQLVPLKLENGRFKLHSPLAGQGREIFIRWYAHHARPWIKKRSRLWTPRFDVQPKGMEIRDLGYRWGSCGKTGIVNFHWAVILLPPGIVDYVIVHELAHLIEPNHTPAFWQQVSRVLPDYEQRKIWLAEKGGGAVAL